MIGGHAEIDGDGYGEKVQVTNGGGGMEGKSGVESGGLQSEDEAAPKIVERSAYHTPQHAEAEPNKNSRYLPHLDNGDIRVSDLVRCKLEGYPWWSSEIFYPSDASKLALKRRIGENHLVMFFDDDTFAWCDESQLMPFMTNYAQMEKQSSSDEFVNAVNYALEELSRRILLGMSCLCSPEEFSDSGMSYLVENHGLREGVTCSITNRAEILKHFCPEYLLRYIKSLALFPGEGGDLLELVIACSQLTSFYRSKGCPELATFQTTNGWAENAMEEDVSIIVHFDHDMPIKGIGKRKPEDDIESMEKTVSSNLYNSCSYDYPGERQMVCSADELKPKRGRNTINVHSPEVEMSDHMNDSYWSELSLHNDPTYSLKRVSTRTMPPHKGGSFLERSAPSSHKKQVQVIERSIIYADAKMAHEVKPTSLVLSFGRSTALPSETDPIKMFRHYGPLKQIETEVCKDTNIVKVVFKICADAKKAFGVAGNYCTFGPWLQNYRLVNMPFSLGPLEASNPVMHPEAI